MSRCKKYGERKLIALMESDYRTKNMKTNLSCEKCYHENKTEEYNFHVCICECGSMTFYVGLSGLSRSKEGNYATTTKKGKIVLNGLIFSYKKSLLLKYNSYEGKDPNYLIHCLLLW